MNGNGQTNKDTSKVSSAFEKCKGKDKHEVFEKLATLTSEDRMAIVDYFNIKPNQIFVYCHDFWCQVKEITLTKAGFAEQHSSLKAVNE